MKNPIRQLFDDANNLFRTGDFETSLQIFLKLKDNSDHKDISAICHYRIAQISNMIGEPERAYELHYKALEIMPNIASFFCAKEHTSHGYVFSEKKDEKMQAECPLCGNKETSPRWCYPLWEANHYNSIFNPVRMWMYCDPCHHMYARHFPENPFTLAVGARTTDPVFFGYYARILQAMREKGYATGMSLFDVGLGASECLLAAREVGYETFGIDVIDTHVKTAREKFGLTAEVADFIKFETSQKYDVIIMGDVIEHVSDPILALKKAESLLNDDGAIWISTPNFESAFSAVASHGDTMRRQQYHINYFSRESFYKTLALCNLAPVEYQISQHYTGSMEVIVVKESRLSQ